MNNYSIRYFVLDVDGVLTTGQFIYSKHGKLYKIFGPHDNDGIKLLKGRLEIRFLTADRRGFSISKKRIVDDMGQRLDYVNEDTRLQYVSDTFGLENTIYMGDGIHDVSILKGCAYGIAPNNARREAKKAADYITPSNGGEGAVLDACLKIAKTFF